jgi:hypothetical protein
MSINSENEDLELDDEQAKNVVGGKTTKATRKTGLPTPAPGGPLDPSSTEGKDSERSLQDLEGH